MWLECFLCVDVCRKGPATCKACLVEVSPWRVIGHWQSQCSVWGDLLQVKRALLYTFSCSFEIIERTTHLIAEFNGKGSECDEWCEANTEVLSDGTARVCNNAYWYTSIKIYTCDPGTVVGPSPPSISGDPSTPYVPTWLVCGTSECIFQCLGDPQHRKERSGPQSCGNWAGPIQIP